MASLRARLIDRNRYSKRYPLIRAPKRLTYEGDEDLALEVGSVYFDNTDIGTFKFEIPLPAGYFVQAMARESGGESADVNLYLKLGEATASQVSIRASAPFTGYVDILVIKVG